MTDNPLGPWGTAIGDQIAAAVEHNDWEKVAQLGVEGYLQTVMREHGGQELPYEYFVATLGRMNPNNVALWAAEALRRLYNERRGS